MTREQLQTNLNTLGVHANSYSLDGIRHSDCVCVLSDNTKWKVCYVERDKPADLAVLDTEEEAYDFVYETFSKWLGVQTLKP